MMQAFENQRFTDRRNTVRGGSADFRFLNRSVQRVGFVAADPVGMGASADFCGFADLLRDSGTDT